MKNKIIELYKNTNDLEIKRNLLHLLNNKYLRLGLGDADFKTELLLDKVLKCRYGRNYNSVIYEI